MTAMRFACADCLGRDGITYRTLTIDGPIICDLCGRAAVGGVLLGEARDTEPAEPRRIEVRSCVGCPWYTLRQFAGRCELGGPPGVARPDVPPPNGCPLRAGDVVVGLGK